MLLSCTAAVSPTSNGKHGRRCLSTFRGKQLVSVQAIAAAPPVTACGAPAGSSGSQPGWRGARPASNASCLGGACPPPRTHPQPATVVQRHGTHAWQQVQVGARALGNSHSQCAPALKCSSVSDAPQPSSKPTLPMLHRERAWAALSDSPSFRRLRVQQEDAADAAAAGAQQLGLSLC